MKEMAKEKTLTGKEVLAACQDLRYVFKRYRY